MMATLNAPFPDLFLPCLGEPIIPFTMWIRMFRDYLLVVGATGDAWPEERKRALLLHCLETEGQRIFYTLPETRVTLETAITALSTHFTPAINAGVECHNFQK